MGLTVDAEGRVYVAERDNHRVQVFWSDGYWFDAFGERGTMDGQFDEPYDVAIAGDGRIYVSDGGNDRILVYRRATPAAPARATLPLVLRLRR